MLKRNDSSGRISEIIQIRINFGKLGGTLARSDNFSIKQRLFVTHIVDLYAKNIPAGHSFIRSDHRRPHATHGLTPPFSGAAPVRRR
jgi:hypothetical protein